MSRRHLSSTYRGQPITAIERERFEAKIVPEPNSGCWLWAGAVTPTGYGNVTFRRQSIKAHRLSYLMHCDEMIAPGMVVCHSCDTPSCVNPDHLWLGSTSENQKDAFRKGRRGAFSNLGEEHHSSKLTAEDVAFIRSHRREKGTTAALARRFGVGLSTITRAFEGRTWSHV